MAVLGAGSWGTALAIQWARAGHAVRLWARDAQLRADMARSRVNPRYLPRSPFPETLQIPADLPAALAGADDVLIAVPSHAFRELLGELRDKLAAGQRLCWATKGFEVNTGRLPYEVAQEVLGTRRLTAVLSGPTFAAEVGAGLPSAMTIASRDADYAALLAHDISTANFRAYTSTDIVGVEVGGAVKNVLAIGAGLSDGLGFGANSRIALITRGLLEMMRLGVSLGAQRETFMGLAGLLLARGRDAAAALAEIGQVVEGYVAARALRQVAQREGVSMPICEGIYGVLYDGLAADEVVRGLMMRPIKAEFDEAGV